MSLDIHVNGVAASRAYASAAEFRDAESGAVQKHDAGEAPSRRIMVVDDNEDSAEMLAEVLTQKGYEARVAHDGAAALALAEQFQPTIALVDIGLPAMDGYELASHLRALPIQGGLRLIALTGYGQPSDRQRTREAGFDHHLVKPVDLATLEAALASG
jgi:CheY-like chemotaxis protein